MPIKTEVPVPAFFNIFFNIYKKKKKYISICNGMYTYAILIICIGFCKLVDLKEARAIFVEECTPND